MNSWELLMAGIKLLIFGMGMVYVFLIIMIYVMKGLRHALAPFSARFEPAAKPVPVRRPAAAAAGNDAELAAIAVAAVHAALGNAGAAPGRGHVGAPAGAPGPAPNKTVREVSARAPLPGKVCRIAVHVGDEVAAGETVLVLEAMKMETEIKAEQSGVMAAIEVNTDQVVAADDVLFRMEVR